MMTRAFFALGLLACTKAAVPETRVERADAAEAKVDAAVEVQSVATAVADAGVDARAPAAKAWTDDIVVRELAKDCAWAPKLPKEEEAGMDWQSDFKVSPLACDMHFAQSCAPDPCYGRVVTECGPNCGKACDTCGATCATKCASCKKDCTDDACKLACARTCGECHDGCVKEADHCRTAKCGAESAACYKREYEKFTRMGCAKVCDAMSTCYMECMSAPDTDTSRCMSKCSPKMGKCAKDYDYGCAVGWRPQPAP